MKTILNPAPEAWAAICERPVMEAQDLETLVLGIMDHVRDRGDAALLDYTRKFDHPDAETVIWDQDRIREAAKSVDAELKAAIGRAKENLEKFHRSQFEPVQKIETSPGVVCWRRSLPIERVGLYIPGGTAPLFSTLLMLAVPARIAGASTLVVATPPNKAGEIHPAICFTADLLGIDRLYAVGGAQAIAAMTYGTDSVPAVDKIFGPGNQYVTQAKILAQRAGVAMDLPAGPSELLVIADDTANPAFIAADLLSQAEHGRDSQVIFVTDSEAVLHALPEVLASQLEALPRKDIAREALAHSRAVLLSDAEACVQFSNLYAPEHLILAVDKPLDMAEQITNAGSVFLGHFTPESAGDYASGTNHTLPTNGFARNFSGVSLDSFVKKITFQEISESGIQDLGPAIEAMAAAELLQAHKNAVTVRLQALQP